MEIIPEEEIWILILLFFETVIAGIRWIFCIHCLPSLCITWFNWSDIKMLSWLQ